MSDSFNYLIDSLSAAFMRLFELPIFFIILGFLVFVVVVKLIYARVKKRKAKWNTTFILFLLFFVSVLIVDKKIANLSSEINEANEKYHNSMLGGATMDMGANLVDEKKILEVFPADAVVQSRKTNAATQLVLFSKNNSPLAKAYIAVVDLTYPTLKVHLSNDLSKKTLTSEFAKKYNCNVAVNGEAGNSMSMDATLGEWTGNYIINGKAYLQEDSDKRPFLSFSENNQAKYFEEKIVDTANTPEKYNTIWGRFDILLNGEVCEQEEERPYPRTILGIDKSGKKLYIMVVDGKRPNYSLGLSYQECAAMLHKIGAYNVMACDQGGSSCMYVKEVNGLVNRPADSEGIERPIYTHFGISVK